MPFELAARCIMAASKKGDLVLDPFAGSGTTLMAAKHRERNYIGIEINEGYRPLIEQRLGLATQRQAELDAVRRMVTLMRTGT
jgi:site-specific DNA-methyltransferase (adenine-specific)